VDFTGPEGHGSRLRVGTSVASGGPRAATTAQGGSKIHGPEREGGIMTKLYSRAKGTQSLKPLLILSKKNTDSKEEAKKSIENICF
jgi:hypothetical protein